MGGGAQAALKNLLRRTNAAHVSLVVLFNGSTGIDDLRPFVDRVVELGAPKTAWGVWMASRRLEAVTRGTHAVYSLMRASHVVIGLRAGRVLSEDQTFVATFHQLPSADSAGRAGVIEDVLVRRATRRASLVTAPSRRAVEEIVSMRMIDSNRVRFEPNLLSARPIGTVRPRQGRLDDVRLLFAGRLTAQKGLDRLPELLHAVDHPIHLRIAGDGPERERLELLAAQVSKIHTVEFLGSVLDVSPHLDWCDALFMPSRAELNPVTVWEARLAGRPTIASSIPAFIDLADDGGVELFASAAGFRDRTDRLAHDDAWRDSCFVDLPAVAMPYTAANGSSHIVDALLEEGPRS
jgi:glycosyltransferase involved in cell wall biosynthesis